MTEKGMMQEPSSLTYVISTVPCASLLLVPFPSWQAQTRGMGHLALLATGEASSDTKSTHPLHLHNSRTSEAGTRSWDLRLHAEPGVRRVRPPHQLQDVSLPEGDTSERHCSHSGGLALLVWRQGGFAGALEHGVPPVRH